MGGSMNPTLHDAMRSTCTALGVVYRDVPADGRWHDADLDGDPRGRGDGRIKLFADGEGGIVCNWKSNDTRPFFADDGRTFTEGERRERDRKREESIRRAREEDERRHQEAQTEARRIWNAAAPTTAHPYLTKKGVKGIGVRKHSDGRLLVPVIDAGGTFHSLQYIDGAGDKRFHPNGRVAGCFHRITGDMAVICIVEGLATGLSVHEATGYAVAVAFNAGNLLVVAQALREKYPEARMILVADDDHATAGNPGVTKSTAAARAVGGFVALPDFEGAADRGTDANDLHQCKGLEAVKRCIENATPPQALHATKTAPDVSTHTGNPANAPAGNLINPVWPEAMDAAAMHGIAGEFVRMVEPNTEADSAAVLVQFLVSFGALVGRGPHYRVEGDEHHANLFALMVGATSKGRKGTSWSRVREAFERISDWKPHVSGLSSGEGLKYNVRDPVEGLKTAKNGEQTLEVTDPGVTDKRLLVTESEFANALRSVKRQGNTLSATVREAWDSGNLRTLTKNDPVTATGAHVCIIGHVTGDELRSELTATDTANGFANRFLFVAVRRSKLLPFGGDDVDPAELQAFIDRIRDRACMARTRRRLRFTGEAKAAWATVYPQLSAGTDGLHGAVTARAEAQCIRLALIYCLLDGAEHIDVPHLLAALAVWQYCDATAHCVFGGSLGDPAADEIMDKLRQAGERGMTRTDLRDAFNRNMPHDKATAALDLLQRRGLVRQELRKTGEAGRPTEVWRAAA